MNVSDKVLARRDIEHLSNVLLVPHVVATGDARQLVEFFSPVLTDQTICACDFPYFHYLCQSFSIVLIPNSQAEDLSTA